MMYLRSFGCVPASPVGEALLPENDLLRMALERLAMTELGIVTPWATRHSDFKWTEVKSPEFNVQLFQLPQVRLNQLTQAMMGAMPPYFVVLSRREPTQVEAEMAGRGTPYGFYEVQAAYAQDDRLEPPGIVYLVWYALRSPNDEARGGGSVDSIASRLSGAAATGLQLPYAATAKRGKPVTPFATALLGSRVTGDPVTPTPPGGGTPTAPPQVYTPPQVPPGSGGSTTKASVGFMPFIIGAAFLAGGFIGVRSYLKGAR
jgi:hypothetical protein